MKPEGRSPALASASNHPVTRLLSKMKTKYDVRHLKKGEKYYTLNPDIDYHTKLTKSG
jgi:hypothetical protein